jgi:glycolate oxidase FAD binding subunit
LGNPARGVQAVLSTERMSGIGEFDAQDGVIHVAAGTPLREIAERVEPEGWELPLDPPGATTTVGGVIATSATGPRRHGFGAPRSCILGLQVALASGERTSCGGRVVKNVTGYDMAKLYTGSLGTLGVIESAWLRLRPAPQETRTTVAVFSGADTARAFSLALAAARRSSTRVAALVAGDPAVQLGAPQGDAAGSVLVVESAADEASVTEDLEWLAREAGARSVPTEARLVGRLRDLQGSGVVRARLAMLPSDLERGVTLLGDLDVQSGAGTIVYPGLGIVYALADSTEALPAIEDATRALPADLLLEALPEDARASRDVFGDPGPLASINRSLKQRFDPEGILNPGRFQGRL